MAREKNSSEGSPDWASAPPSRVAPELRQSIAFEFDHLYEGEYGQKAQITLAKLVQAYFSVCPDDLLDILKAMVDKAKNADLATVKFLAEQLEEGVLAQKDPLTRWDIGRLDPAEYDEFRRLIDKVTDEASTH